MKRNVEDLENKLKELTETLVNNMSGLKEKVHERLEQAINEPCTINIEKKDKGNTQLKVKGDRLSILITLAGLENHLLEQLDCDEKEWNGIKKLIGTREV